jgi:hypothetical protein
MSEEYSKVTTSPKTVTTTDARNCINIRPTDKTMNLGKL